MVNRKIFCLPFLEHSARMLTFHPHPWITTTASCFHPAWLTLLQGNISSVLSWRRKTPSSISSFLQLWAMRILPTLSQSHLDIQFTEKLHLSKSLLLLFNCSVESKSLRPHELQHSRLPRPSPSPGLCSNSCPLCRWYHPVISSAVVPFSSCLQSFPASGSFPVSQLFTSGGQRTGASASAPVLPRNIQGWFPLRLTGLISLQTKGLSNIK